MRIVNVENQKELFGQEKLGKGREILSFQSVDTLFFLSLGNRCIWKSSFLELETVINADALL